MANAWPRNLCYFNCIFLVIFCIGNYEYFLHISGLYFGEYYNV